MFTSWDQVHEWITDNNFKRWIFYADSSRKEKIIDSKAFTASDMTEKLAMTEKYLKRTGGRMYGSGFADNGSENGTVCVVCLEQEHQQPTSGIGGGQSVDEITRLVTEKVRAEIRLEDQQKREKDLERREKEFAEKEAGVWGVIVEHLAPVAQMMMAKRNAPLVAGVDTADPIDAEPIKPAAAQEPDPAQEQEESVWDKFTEEEGEKIGDLMAQWKSIEPDYLAFLEKIVTMAKNGDPKYTMAKSFI